MFLSEPRHCWTLLFAMGSGLRDEILAVKDMWTQPLMGTPPYSAIGPWSECSDCSGTRDQAPSGDGEQEEERNLRYP